MKARSPRPANTLIRASAGTGKTYQLSNRFLALLLDGAEPGKILATTFTRKAAGEILDRVLLRLARAVADAPGLAELAQALDRPALDRGQCLRLLVRLTRELHRLRVATLDSFFAQVAGSFALELGLPPGWAICEEVYAARLRDEAIEEVLASESTAELQTLVKLLARGETSRDVSRVIRSTIQDLYALFQDTTPEAWQRIPRPRGLPEGELSAALERLASAPLSNSMAEARDKDLARALAGDWLKFPDSGVAAKVAEGDFTYRTKPIPAAVVQLYEQLLQHGRAQVLNHLANQTDAAWKLLSRFDAALVRLKRERQALRFEDVTRALAQVGTLPSSDALAFRLDGQIDHLLLDEFQDTSPTQWQVLRPFARRVAEGTQTSFFCVGDVKQAIYGWRGGLAEIFDSLPGELSNLQGETLARSFRSSPAVMAAVNQVFAGLRRHGNLNGLAPVVEDWSAKFPEHSTALVNLPGYACLETGPAPQEDEQPEDALLRHTAQRVKQMLADAPGCSIGVLTRRNETVGRLVYELRRLKVPASEEGASSLTDSAPVELILSLCQLADHPGDTIARFHVATSPLARHLPLGELHDHHAAGTVAADIRRRLAEEGYGPVLRSWAELLAPASNRRDRARLQQLLELAWQYQPQSTLRPGDFLHWIRSAKVADPTTDRVRVMTVHQAKGLEFDIVFLAELDEQILGQEPAFVAHRPTPTEPVDLLCRYVNKGIQQLLPPDLRELFAASERQRATESLCGLYVALTRAAHALYMLIEPSSDSEHKLPRTLAGLVRAALTEGNALPPDQLAWETNAADCYWFKRLPPAKESAPAAPPLPRTIPLAPTAERRGRGLERVRPSGLEGGRQIRLEDLLRLDSPIGRQRGTLFHLWLQTVEWLEDRPPVEPPLRELARRHAAELGDLTQSLEQLLAEWQAALRQPEIAALLRPAYYASRGSRWEVAREHPFAVRQGNELAAGSIDRLVFCYEGANLSAADVIDFKTDALPPGDAAALAAKVEFYRPQLEAYRRAVLAQTRLPPDRVTARLAFLAIGQVVEIPVS